MPFSVKFLLTLVSRRRVHGLTLQLRSMKYSIFIDGIQMTGCTTVKESKQQFRFKIYFGFRQSGQKAKEIMSLKSCRNIKQGWIYETSDTHEFYCNPEVNETFVNNCLVSYNDIIKLYLY